MAAVCSYAFICKREAMSEVYVHQDEQVTTKKAPYLHHKEEPGLRDTRLWVQSWGTNHDYRNFFW